MVIDLRSVFVTEGETLHLKETFDFSRVDYAGGYPFSEPVRLEGEVKNRAGVVTLEAEAAAVRTAGCDRCGVLCEQPVRVHMAYTLVHALANSEERDDYLVVGDSLDLEPLVLSELILSLPSKHLCRPDCKGLCGTCGKNLNEGPCGCGKTSVDPRLEALKQLLD